MSHVAIVECEINDLDALARAVARCGLQLDRQPGAYRWYGRSVGDYPMPHGFTAADLGHADVAVIRATDGNARMYEIGVCNRRDGKPGYALLWDFYAGGFGLQDKVGANCETLTMLYGVEVARAECLAEGYSVTETMLQDGSIDLLVERSY